MTQKSAPLPCPWCGSTMVHHADKLVEPTNKTEWGRIDPALGGVIQQTHGCPNCGHVEFRPDNP
jgi:ribosomal protein S27AE